MMNEKQRPPNGESPEGMDPSERQAQREILEKVLKKSKINLSPEEKDLMNDLLAELDLLHLRKSDLENRLGTSTALKNLILLAQQEEEQEALNLDAEPQEAITEQASVETEESQPEGTRRETDSTSAPSDKSLRSAEKSTARVKRESDIGVTGVPSKPSRPKSVRPRSRPKAQRSESPKPRPRPKEATRKSPPKRVPHSELRASIKPEDIVAKFIEAWNSKAFAAEYSCFAKKSRIMEKDDYVERRMDIYLQETQEKPVTRTMGRILFKRTYGNNAEVICERIILEGEKERTLVENYFLHFEGDEWKIVEVQSAPERSRKGVLRPLCRKG